PERRQVLRRDEVELGLLLDQERVEVRLGLDQVRLRIDQVRQQVLLEQLGLGGRGPAARTPTGPPEDRSVHRPGSPPTSLWTERTIRAFLLSLPGKTPRRSE